MSEVIIFKNLVLKLDIVSCLNNSIDGSYITSNYMMIVLTGPVLYTSIFCCNFFSPFLQLISSYAELISDHPSPFNNLKRLKIYHVAELLKEQEQNKVTMSTEVKSYLLDNSADATFTMVTREVGDEVFFKSIINFSEKVARGRVKSLDPNEQVRGKEIGR